METAVDAMGVKVIIAIPKDEWEILKEIVNGNSANIVG